MAPISLGSNISSLNAQRQLAKSSDRFARVSERLSSGQRINRPSDDAASASISSSLNVTKKVFTQGIRNINDGISALNLAEGALSQLSDITMRQRELAEQAANGSFSLTQRKAMNTEAYQLTQEFNRITASTTFNGQTLLDGSVNNIRVQSGFGVDGGVGIAIGDSLYRGIWNGVIPSSTTTITASSVAGEATGDINGDGRADIVTFSSTGGIIVSLGNADGTFTSSAKSIGINGQTTMQGQLVDFNNDGKLDLVAYSPTSQIQVALGDGAGGFQTATTLGGSSTNMARNVSVVDVNNDGFLDIIDVVSFSGLSQQVFLGRGNGTFTAVASVNLSTTSPSTLTSAAGDLNNDGYADLVISTGSASGTFVLYGKSSGALGSATNYASVTINIAGMGDLNHDGFKDIVFESGVMLGSASGPTAYASRTGAATGGNIASLVDINGDGELDLVNNTNTSFMYTLGDGTGSFGSLVSKAVSLGSSTTAIKLGDFNGDGVQDLVDSTSTNPNVLFLGASRVGTIARFDILDQSSARTALTNLSAQQDKITGELGLIGSSRSRLEASLANLSASNTEVAAAYGRITDTDVAQESANLVRESITQQVGSAILAQANQQPNLVLKLLGTG